MDPAISSWLFFVRYFHGQALRQKDTMKNRLNSEDLKREIGLFSATILVIANMVGTGIFTTSGFIMKELGNPQTMLFCWFVGGIFALCGALCYGELGALFPKAGGEYVFLRESFGKWMGFLSGWISLIVGFSAPIAAASIAFAGYFFRVVPAAFNLNLKVTFHGIDMVTVSPAAILAASMIIVFSLLHYHSLSLGTKVQNGLTVFKISLICIFIAAGLFWGRGSTSHFSGSLDIGSVFQDKFAVSLIFISFAYSGWNAAAYLGSEIKRPGKNIPMALFTGTGVVICLYVLLNVIYIYALSPKQMGGVLEVGANSAVSLFGKSISNYFSGAIAIGLLSVLSAMIVTGPRVYYAMAKDGIFFQIFGKVDKLHRTPGHAIFLQAAIAIVMVVTASFDKLLIYIGFTLSLFATITVLGMIALRMRQPDLKRDYKTVGYPLTPVLFILGNVWIIYFSIKSRPIASLLGIVTIGSGILVYACFSRRRKRKS